MNRNDIEKQLLQEIHQLPFEKLKEILDFAIKQREICTMT